MTHEGLREEPESQIQVLRRNTMSPRSIKIG